jgi:hypothetical protein
MRKEFVITMMPEERNKYRRALENVREILVEDVRSIDDDKDRSLMWDKIRMLNDVVDIFKD